VISGEPATVENIHATGSSGPRLITSSAVGSEM
jgi:hypothetical protein